MFFAGAIGLIIKFYSGTENLGIFSKINVLGVENESFDLES